MLYALDMKSITIGFENMHLYTNVSCIKCQNMQYKCPTVYSMQQFLAEHITSPNQSSTVDFYFTGVLNSAVFHQIART